MGVLGKEFLWGGGGEGELPPREWDRWVIWGPGGQGLGLGGGGEREGSCQQGSETGGWFSAVGGGGGAGAGSGGVRG